MGGNGDGRFRLNLRFLLLGGEREVRIGGRGGGCRGGSWVGHDVECGGIGQGHLRGRSHASYHTLPPPDSDYFLPTMDSADLFSFLEQAPDENWDAAGAVEIPVRKRKANTPVEQPVQNGEQSHSGENGFDSPSHKKQRFASPAPIVLDEVEVEAKREVKVSAGLMSAETDETGPRLELRHQARQLVGISRSWINREPTGQAPSRCALMLSIRSDLKTRPASQTRTGVQVHPRPLPTTLGERNSTKRKRAGLCSHQCRENCRRRVRHCSMLAEQAEGDIHEPDQSPK